MFLFQKDSSTRAIRRTTTTVLLGVLCLLMTPFSSALPPQECPSSLFQSGQVNDLALLADTVSWPSSSQEIVDGICGTYINTYEKQGKYDTMLRVYTNNNTRHTIFSFRPTQQTSEGGEIHNDRRLSACRFLNDSCYGMVNDRFQQAFLSLVEDLDADFFDTIRSYDVSTVGHSLGGSLQLFMAVYLSEMWNIQPSYVLGFAGPFIGDEVFTQTYIDPLKESIPETMWQIETVDINNLQNFDGTAESYNVNNGEGTPNWGALPFNPLSPFRPFVPQESTIKTPIFIDEQDICGVHVVPLPESYGMHDLKNYRLGFQGTECSSSSP